MKKLKKHPLRLRTNHSRFPVDLIMKVPCKYCGRKPLVGNFDFSRTIDDKEYGCCVECYDAGRAFETSRDSIIGLGYVMSGLKKYHFPWSPEKGTPKKELVGNCNVCGKPVYSNPYTRCFIGAYHEILRDVLVHNKCDKKFKK